MVSTADQASKVVLLRSNFFLINQDFLISFPTSLSIPITNSLLRIQPDDGILNFCCLSLSAKWEATRKDACCSLPSSFAMPAGWLEQSQPISEIPKLQQKSQLPGKNKDLNPKHCFKEIKHLIGVKWLLSKTVPVLDLLSLFLAQECFGRCKSS